MQAPTPSLNRQKVASALATPPRTESSQSVSERMNQLADQFAKLKRSDRIKAEYQFAVAVEPSQMPETVAATYANPTLKYLSTELLFFWAERDLPTLRTWYEGLSSKMSKDLGEDFLTATAAVDPRGTLERLEKASPDERSALLETSVVQSLAELIGPVEPDRLTRLLMPLGADAAREGPGQFKSPALGTELSTLYTTLAEHQPAETAARALALPPGKIRTEAVTAVAQTWAASDPKAARAWADSIQDAALGEQVTGACAAGMASASPAEAVAWIEAQPATAGKKANLRQIFAVWAASDPKAALDWIDAQPNDAGFSEYIGAVLDGDTFGHPTRGIQLLIDRLTSGKSLGDGLIFGMTGVGYASKKGPDAALAMAGGPIGNAEGVAANAIWQGLVQIATQADPEKAAAWALTQPEGEARQRALRTVVDRWENQDISSALTWAEGLAVAKEFDSVRDNLSETAAIVDLDSALEILNGISDPDDKKEFRANAIERAWNNNAAETEDWLRHTTQATPVEKAEAKANFAKWKREAQ